MKKNSESYVAKISREIKEKFSQRYALYRFNNNFYNFVQENLFPLELEPIKKGPVKNICTKNDTFDVLLLAHYDTPPQMPFPRLSNCILRKFGHGYSYDIIFGIAIASFIVLIYFFISNTFSHSDFIKDYPKISFLAIIAIQFILYLLLTPNKNNMNDNSSGVIATLAIIKKISDIDKELLKSIKVVFTDFEELGLFGARKLKKDLKNNLDNKLIINFDGVGIGTHIYVQPLNSFNQSRNTLVKDYLSEYQIIKDKIRATSDYDIFKEYHSLGITFLNKASKEMCYYVPNYHTPQDTKLDIEQIEDFSAKMAQFLVDHINKRKSNN